MWVGVLGPLEVRCDGQAVDLRSPTQRVLLAVLALRTGRPVSADELVDAVWRDELPAKPSTALQIQVSRLRKSLPDGAIATSTDGYLLNIPADDVDVHRFETFVADGRRLAADGCYDEAGERFAAALGLWRGFPFTDLNSCQAFDAAAMRLADERLAVLESRFHCALETGVVGDLLPELESLVVEHPLRESFTRLLMTALYRAGRQSDALRHYQELRRRLRDELGVRPSPDLADLELAILTHDDRLAGPSRAPGPTSGSRPPSPLTSFVGRQEELAMVVDALERHRLITIVGPGGAGKTRLVTELFDQLGRSAGPWFVGLAEVDIHEIVPTVCAAAFGVDAAGAIDPIDLVVRRLGATQGVVVIDNCEHVLDTAADVVRRLLSGCPNLRVVATSRGALMLQGEWILALEGLPTGDEARGDAELLFVDRAAARQGAALADSVVSRICRLVDGWPLAIELAAANTDRIDLGTAIDDVERRLAELRSPYRDVPERHASLMATIDWSYRLLDDELRRAHRALGLFEGPITRDGASVLTAAAVADPWGAVVELARRSLVVLSEDGSRATMLRPVVQHARAVGERADETPSVRQRFVELHDELTRRADSELEGEESATSLALLREQEPNIVRAVELALADRRFDVAVAISVQTGYSWLLTSRQLSGLAVIERVFDAAGDELAWTAVRDLLQAAGYLHGSRGRWDRSRECLTAVLELQQEHDDLGRIATLGNLANVLEQELLLTEALDAVDEAERLFPDDAEMIGRSPAGNVRWSLRVKRASLLACLGRYDEARDAADGATVAAEELGGAYPRLAAVGAAAEACIGAGAAATARALLDEMSALSDELGGVLASLITRGRAEVDLLEGDVESAEAELVVNLAHVPDHESYQLAAGLLVRAEIQIRNGDDPSARSTLDRCLNLVVEGRSGELIPGALLATAVVLERSGRVGDASTLVGASSAIQDRTGCTVRPWITRPNVADHGPTVDRAIDPIDAGRLALGLLRAITR